MSFYDGLYANCEAVCAKCGSHQPIQIGYVTTHLRCIQCATCGEIYQWEDGRPMIIRPSSIGPIVKRMDDVFFAESNLPCPVCNLPFGNMKLAAQTHKECVKHYMENDK